MVIKIQPANPDIMAAVNYNEKKTALGQEIRDPETNRLDFIEDATVLVTRNVPEGKTFVDELLRLEDLANKKKRGGRKLNNETFHMSVNPSEDDKKLTDEETVNLIDEVMKRLGYEGQPYRIYRHNDIEREHYHVVSTRVGQDGFKIKDSFEQRRLQQIMNELKKEFGFEIGKKEEKDKKKQEQKNAKNSYVPPFDRESEEPVTEQIKNAVEDALTWHFMTFEQLQALMLRKYRIAIEIYNNEEETVVLSGTDKNGKILTPPITEDELGVEYGRMIRERLNNETMNNRREQRDRLERIVYGAAGLSDSYEEFVEKLQKKGIIVVVSWNKENEPFGVTYLDKATKCAWKGSQTKYTLNWLKETAEKKGWTITKDAIQQAMEKRLAQQSKKASFDIKEPASTNKRKGSSFGKIQLPYPLRPRKNRGGQTRINDQNRHSTSSVADRKGDETWKDHVEDKPKELIQ